MHALTSCTVARGDFRDWQAAILTNGLVRAVAVPDIGGRLMAYDLGDTPYLFVDPQLAGKLFTAGRKPGQRLAGGLEELWRRQDLARAPGVGYRPDQWPGPPDPILDTGRYRLTN